MTEAVSLAINGDEVVVAEGEYLLESGIVINQPLFVHAAGSREATVINGQRKFEHCFSILSAGAVVDGFTITGGGDAVCDVGAYEFHGSAVDSDEDGLPDGWEMRYGGSLTQMCVAADFDRDGMADDEEFRAGTSPDRSDSIFAVSSANPADFRAGETILQWAGSPGRHYIVERTDDLAAGFTGPLATGIPATPPLNTFTDSTASAGAGFYRIRLDQ